MESIITKFGCLLAVGFGKAGSKILKENIASGEKLKLNLPGKKILGIFGWIDIRYFSDSVNVLQEDILLLVNEIACIVHSSVEIYNGSANKNLGKGFLIVWKFPRSCYMINKSTN